MTIVLLGLGLVLASGLSAILLRRHGALADHVVRLLLVSGCVALGASAAATLIRGTPLLLELRPALPGGRWIIGLDALSAWFVLALSVVAALTGTYGVRYLADERGHRSVAGAHAAFALLVAGMFSVFLSQAAVCFLIAWEAMAVAAFLLIVFDHEQAEVRRAGLVYLALTHLGTLALFAMFLTWGHSTPDLRFASLAAASPTLPMHGAVVLWLALLGFGIKAGLVPVHFWLPGAHAAAPSHVSALLSGVMVKSGVYGIIRVTSLIGGSPIWLGWTLLFLGLLSGVLGVLWALSQHDVKRLLAYSTVENVGIIFIALGAGGLGVAYENPTLAILGYSAALLHVMNHALFKSLLFLGAGAVARAAGTRQIDELGGMARLMPRTALTFLVGSLAIIGLPPLNGFLSEWVMVQGLLAAGSSHGVLRFLVLVVAPVGLIAALALAAFTRVIAVIFLGTSRTVRPPSVREPPPGMLLPMAIGAGACVLIGLAPALVFHPVRSVLTILVPPAGAALVPFPRATPIVITWLALAGLSIALGAVLHVRRRRAGVELASTWGCAYPSPRARMQYTGSSFSAPILRAMPQVARPTELATASSFRSIPKDPFYQKVVDSLWGRVIRAAAVARPIQHGRVTVYLQFIVVTLVLLLAFLLLWSPTR